MEFQIETEKLSGRKLFLGLPMYGGQCSGATAKSLMDLTAICTQYGISLYPYFMFNESLITRARNYIADEFLRSECDTLLFIDSDIEFKGIDVLAMMHLQNLDREKYPIMAGPYPKKVISWEKVKAAVDKGFADKDPNELENFVGDYVFSVAKAGIMRLDEPQEILESGTGFMMITREAFEKFRDAYPELQFRPDTIRSEHFDGSKLIHAFFDTVIDPVSKRYLSEDYMFCQYARKIGISTWLCPWMQLKHHGSYVFGGSLSALAAIKAAPSADVKKLGKKHANK